MRVVFNTIESFCGELEDASVVSDIVRQRIDAIPHNEEATGYDYRFWGTALTAVDDQRLLLEVELMSADENDVASWATALSELCEKSGLDLRSGKMELY